MNDYREVKCIELHDSNIAISLPEEAHYTMGIMGRIDDLDKPYFSGQTHDLSIINQTVTSQAFFVPKLGNLALWHFFDTFVLDNYANKIPHLGRDKAVVISC